MKNRIRQILAGRSVPQIIMSLSFGLTALTGLAIFPQRNVDVAYLVLLTIHFAAGLSLLAVFIFIALKRFREVLGNFHFILKFILIVVFLISSFLPLTGEMILIWTTLLLSIDWFFTWIKLRRLGYDRQQRKALGREYLDFAILMQCLLTGLYIIIACLSFLLIYHKIHGLVLPLLLIWFSGRKALALTGRKKWVALGVIASVFVLTIALYYNKQLKPIEEKNIAAEGVHRTIHSKSQRNSLKTLDEVSLSDSQSCSGKGCHNIIVNQWRGSSHRFSVNNIFFRKSVSLYLEMEGPDHVRICINCHDPVAAFSTGAEEQYQQGKIDNPEGISCKACHIITDFDSKVGNGIYTVKAPFVYPFYGAEEDSWERLSYGAGIKSDPRRHLGNYRRKKLYRPGEYCVTCHLVTIPDEVAPGPSFHLHTLFDQWRDSEWAEHQNCVDCHLPRFQMDENGYTFFDHRILGINNDLKLSAEVPDTEQIYVDDFNYFIDRYIKGDLEYNTYQLVADPKAYLFRKNPMKKINPFTLYTPAEMTRFFTTMYFLSGGPIIDMQAKPGSTLDAEGKLKINIKTTNTRVGHNFPSGPIDVQEVWLSTVLEDYSGNELFAIGTLDEHNYVEPGGPILGSRGIVDKDGNPLDRHEFWLAAKVIDKRVLKPFASVTDTQWVQFPELPEGKYKLTIKWNFRRMNQRITDWLYEDGKTTMPVSVLDYSVFYLSVKNQSEGRYRVFVTSVDRPKRKPFDDLQAITLKSATHWYDIARSPY